MIKTKLYIELDYWLIYLHSLVAKQKKRKKQMKLYFYLFGRFKKTFTGQSNNVF